MGRIPVIAAPIPTPAMPASEIGVSRMRSWPNSSERPSVTVNAPPKPPGTPMSSPRQNTEGSRLISSRMPSRRASAMVIVAKLEVLPENMKQGVLAQWRCTGFSERCRAIRTVISGNALRHRCRCAIKVILTDENDRQTPDGSHVHGLVDGALICAPLPEETDHDLAGPTHFGRQPRAARYRSARAHDG